MVQGLPFLFIELWLSNYRAFLILSIGYWKLIRPFKSSYHFQLLQLIIQFWRQLCTLCLGITTTKCTRANNSASAWQFSLLNLRFWRLKVVHARRKDTQNRDTSRGKGHFLWQKPDTNPTLEGNIFDENFNLATRTWMDEKPYKLVCVCHWIYKD